jgi:hypothetical protein
MAEQAPVPTLEDINASRKKGMYATAVSSLSEYLIVNPNDPRAHGATAE